MTGPEDSPSGTRPISVAELLAKNGTIGAPPVGGRRRRRRGNSDSVTVAELTGEIPIISAEAEETGPDSDVVDDTYSDVTGPLPSNGTVERTPERPRDADPGSAAAETDDEYADAVAEYSAHLESRDADPEPIDFQPHPRRPHYAHAARRYPPAGGGAEEMSPDPFIDDDEDALDSAMDLVGPPEVDYTDETAADDVEDDDNLPSYLRATQGPLFGGQTVADDLARRRVDAGPEDFDLEDEDAEDDEDDAAPETTMSTFLRGAWIVGQCIIAVAFGAGLFVAFDQLWKWNNIVELVLSVLVILGLVVGVRVVRKTEDIGSTLIAVAVGALVTLGPLALLQSG